jgi:nitrate reductase gamma subunit
MLNVFIFIVLPYVALALLAFVTPWRFFSNRLTWSSYSTQFLERETLFWGINPWHYGILPVLAAHFLAVLAPGPLKAFLGNQLVLIVFESLGLALGLLALLGCLLLLLRRAIKPMLKRVTFAPDWILLLLLAAQALTGVYVATFMSWGSEWALYTAVPYVWSLLSLSPRIDLMADFPLVFKLHVASAFVIVALLPFTKLVHLLFVPFRFIKDPPILYRWRTKRDGS